MLKRVGLCLLICALSTAALMPPASARALMPAERGDDVISNPMALAPAYSIAAHRVNKMTLGVSNNGTFGWGYAVGGYIDQFTGQPVPGCEYPAGSGQDYLYAGALWIGAVVGNDTLVSTGADGWITHREFYPDVPPFGYMIRRSTLDPNSPEYAGAVSQEDFVATYTDTFVDLAGTDSWSGLPHQPLYLEVTRSSFAWAYPYAEDFVILHYQVKNIGTEWLRDAYLGLYVDADVHLGGNPMGFDDDITGFVTDATVDYGDCSFVETQNIAWIADNDGDLNAQPGTQVASVTGTIPLAFPSLEEGVNYNWWVSNGSAALDFGPRQRGSASDPFRDFGTGGTGTPMGDANKYYMLRHREFDYDQPFTATIGAADSIWLEPPSNIAADIANGYDTRYLLSLGPIDIGPGQTLPATFAYVAGEGFHTVADNLQNLPNNPQAYEDNLNFDDLIANGRWARSIYDTPGFDTDGDGYFGQFHLCPRDSILVDSVWVYDVVDTIWYSGDGVPDFEGAAPPPPPATWVMPADGGLHVRFNGLVSEETPDPYSRQKDFEGYRVYFTPAGSGGDYALLDSWDRQDWYKWIWSPISQKWVPDHRLAPYTLQDLRCLYGAPFNPCWDETFDPDNYSETQPFLHMDTIMYFEPVDLNHSVFGAQTNIVKTYPNQPYPSTLNPAQADPSELTPDGFFKYFEYQLDIHNLLPTNEYCVKVTAFDFGAQAAGVTPLESVAEPHCAMPQSGGPIPTYEWINVYCDGALLNQMPMAPGTRIEAFDPDGVLCGRDSVRADGAYGFMPIYRDDPYSMIDEGAEPGDTISFRVNGQEVQTYPTVVWTANGAGYNLCQFSACQTLHLNVGWNLISWNRHMTMDIDELMVLLAGCDVDVVLGFDRGALTFDPQLPQYSTLEYVDYHHGYWVKVGNACDVDICAPPIPLEDAIPIYQGWNLVSFWLPQQQEIESALISMYGFLQVALGFNGGGLVYIPQDPAHSTLAALDPGHGYWIRSSENTMLAYPGFGAWLPPPASIVADEPKITPSREWMSIYGQDITLDGRALSDGAVIEAYSTEGTLCGSGVYNNGILKFTPVYGHDDQSEATNSYPAAGASVELRVNGQTVSPQLTFAGSGARAAIGRLISGASVPHEFRLSQNYPNPFNPTTEISFDLPNAAQVKLEVFNVVGQRVSVLVDERLEAGTHSVTFDAGGLASGLYLYRIQAGSYNESRKMMLLK